jgi:hypothetical protein
MQKRKEYSDLLRQKAMATSQAMKNSSSTIVPTVPSTPKIINVSKKPTQEKTKLPNITSINSSLQSAVNDFTIRERVVSFNIDETVFAEHKKASIIINEFCSPIEAFKRN